MEGKVTQKQRILNHLQDEGSITSWEAIQGYGATRLASTIHSLRKEYVINSIDMESINRFGDKIRYAKYDYVGLKSLT